MLPCAELDETLRFFTASLGFRIDAVFPADAPAVASVSGYGLRLRLEVGAAGAPGTLQLACDRPQAVAAGERLLVAPNGTRIELVSADPPLVLPPQQQSFVVHRLVDDPDWGVGRAGMLYRDLIPDRQAIHRLAHPHSRRRSGARLRALSQDPLADDLLLQRLGARRL